MDATCQSISRRVVVIGITGASGSGKSTLASALAADLRSPVVALTMDWFFDDDRIDSELGGNCEAPAALDAELFLSSVNAVVLELSRGLVPHSIKVKTQADPLPIVATSTPRSTSCADVDGDDVSVGPVFLVLDGFLLFAFPEIAELCTIQLLLLSSLEMCCMRRFSRREQGVEVTREPVEFEAFQAWFEKHVFVEGYMRHLALQQRLATRLVSLDSTIASVGSLVEHVRQLLRSADAL